MWKWLFLCLCANVLSGNVHATTSLHPSSPFRTSKADGMFASVGRCLKHIGLTSPHFDISSLFHAEPKRIESIEELAGHVQLIERPWFSSNRSGNGIRSIGPLEMGFSLSEIGTVMARGGSATLTANPQNQITVATKDGPQALIVPEMAHFVLTPQSKREIALKMMLRGRLKILELLEQIQASVQYQEPWLAPLMVPDDIRSPRHFKIRMEGLE